MVTLSFQLAEEEFGFARFTMAWNAVYQDWNVDDNRPSLMQTRCKNSTVDRWNAVYTMYDIRAVYVKSQYWYLIQISERHNKLSQ